MPQADADAEVILHPLAEDQPVGLVDREGQRVGRADAPERDAAGDVGEEFVWHRLSFLGCSRGRGQLLVPSSSSASSFSVTSSGFLPRMIMPRTSSVVTSRLVDRADEPAVVHDADPVGQVEDVVDVVADQEDPDALVLQLADEVADLGGLGRAEGGGRLVHDQDPCVEVDGAGDRHRLALAAGQGLDRLREVA